MGMSEQSTNLQERVKRLEAIVRNIVERGMDQETRVRALEQRPVREEGTLSSQQAVESDT